MRCHIGVRCQRFPTRRGSRSSGVACVDYRDEGGIAPSSKRAPTTLEREGNKNTMARPAGGWRRRARQPGSCGHDGGAAKHLPSAANDVASRKPHSQRCAERGGGGGRATGAPIGKRSASISRDAPWRRRASLIPAAAQARVRVARGSL